MKRHPQYAYDLLSPIAFLRPALDIPWCHHEKWNGTGYPRGLKGEEIPLPARLFAFVDVWDALLSDRPYRKAWPEDRVRDYICSLSGTHFDPELVPIFLSFVSPAVQAPDDDFFSSLELFPAPELSPELRLAA
jgi:putative two-component system response regulator